MKRNYRSIILVAEDRGGYDALLPVAEKIRKLKDFSVELVLAGRASEFAKCKKIKHLKGINPKGKPDIILLGTSGSNTSIDKKIIQSAKVSNIPTISFVDFWSNYNLRFGESGEFLPNYILAIDQRMKRELNMYLDKVKKRAEIVVTGSPRFDRINYSSSGSHVIFYSQPLKGYEVKIFKDIVGGLEKFYPFEKVLLKLHPSEKNEEKFLRIIKRSKLQIKIEIKQSVEQLNKKANLVIGADSMALFISCLMGKKTISYQPGKSEQNDFLASNEYGWSVPAYTKGELFSALLAARKKKSRKRESFEQYTRNDSAQKVVDFIKKLLININQTCKYGS